MPKELNLPVLWDKDNDVPATNWDGTKPMITDSGTVIITDLGCNCDPTSGNMCGSCIETYDEYIIGKNERYYYKKRRDNP